VFTRRLRTPAAQRGLTLVELVVAVVVVGVLAAVAAVGFQSAVDRSQAEATRQSLRSIAREAQLLYQLGDPWSDAWATAAAEASGPLAAEERRAVYASSAWEVLPAGEPAATAGQIAWAAHDSTSVAVTRVPGSGDVAAVVVSSSGVAEATLSDPDPLEVLGGEGLAVAAPNDVVTFGAAGGSVAATWAEVPRASGYTLTATAGGESSSCSTATTTCVVSGLTPGVRYALSVTATNGVVTSAATAGVPRVAGSPANDDVDRPVQLPTLPAGTGQSATVAYSTAGASRQVGEPVGAINIGSYVTVWFRYRVADTDPVQKLMVSRTPAANGATVEVFTGLGWSALVGGNGACGGCAQPPVFQLAGGVDYLIRVGFTAVGSGSLTITDVVRPDNDDVADAAALPSLAPGVPLTTSFNARGSTWEPGEPHTWPTWQGGEGSLWWSYTAPDGVALQTIDVTRSGNKAGPTFRVYRGSWATPVYELQGGCGLCPSSGTFTVEAGHTYLFRLTSVSTASSFTLTAR
jgi:prepilin-type N-terminal cleavage/methylation domain-containing protein